MSANYMIDIETLSTRTNASILTIGAMKFTREGPLPEMSEMETFYRRVNRVSCDDLDMHVDKNTEAWWAKQSDDVRWEAIENPENRQDLKDVLIGLTSFIGKGNPIVWGNGDDFDCVILTEAYRLCGLELPWKFWNTRDVRTVMDLGNVKPWDLPSISKHHPVHDCYHQIIGLKRSFKNIGMFN